MHIKRSKNDRLCVAVGLESLAEVFSAVAEGRRPSTAILTGVLNSMTVRRIYLLFVSHETVFVR